MKEHKFFYKYESEIVYWYLGKNNIIYSVFQLEHFFNVYVISRGKGL